MHNLAHEPQINNGCCPQKSSKQSPPFSPPTPINSALTSQTQSPVLYHPARYVAYNPTSLERNYKHELLTEHDLGVTIDLIDPDRYTVDDGGELDPADERLLEEDSLAPQDFKRCVRGDNHRTSNGVWGVITGGRGGRMMMVFPDWWWLVSGWHFMRHLFTRWGRVSVFCIFTYTFVFTCRVLRLQIQFSRQFILHIYVVQL